MVDKKKASLRRLSKEEPTLEEVQAQATFVHSGPALSTAILMAAKLDHELEALLLSKLSVHDDALIETLTSATGPLSTFSQKIDLAYALGFCDATARENMHIVRKVRNLFAHASKVFEFDHPLISAEIFKLKLPRRLKGSQSVRSALRNKVMPRDIYVAFCYILSNSILSKHTSLVRKRTASIVARTKKLNAAAAELREKISRLSDKTAS